MYPAYPIRFFPIYRDYLWGGSRIAQKYNRQTSLVPIAESWEISDRPSGMSVVANGPLKGLSLSELTTAMGERLLGENRIFPSFPLLIKIIDAKEPLSIQVHPSNQNASILKADPKTEMWYVLEAPPEALVYAGFKKDVTKEEFLQALKGEELLELLEVHKAIPSEAIYIPGGCIHAIGSGCLMLEVQQNSDSTYRVYDWQRKGLDGKARQLHIQEALQAIDWSFQSLKVESSKGSDLVKCPYFAVSRQDILGSFSMPHRPDSFQIFFCLSGDGTISLDGFTEPMHAGMTYLIPACFASGNISGSLQTIHITL
ncbi:MAG: class I mannose-6-phosphate isomerase [Chlamydiae bacterium]|nr:class I mannose-6-phosphate isomerase [Chlamydiota bacterium]